MAQMSDKDYNALDEFVRAILVRVAEGQMTVEVGTTTIMHPLTAWDQGTKNEFLPWIKSWLKEHKDA